MANRFSDYLTPDEFAQLMKTNPTAVTGNRELEAIAQFKAEGGKLKGDLPQPPAASFDEWGGGFDHAEAAQKLMDDVENAETNLDYDATKEPWVGKAFNNTIEKIKDTQLYAQYMYSPEDWVDKGKEIFDVTGIDVKPNDKELFNKAWNVTKEYKKKAAIYTDENGHVNMDKVYEAMPYLRDIHEAHGTSAAVQVMRSAKQLQTINDLYDSEGARFLASLGYGAKGAAMQAGLQVYGAKAMLNGLLFGERLTDKQANDIMWFQKQLESIPEFSYTSVGGAVGGALGSAVENAPIMLPEMARTAAVALGKIPVPMAKALGVLTYAAMSTQIAGQQYIDNLLKTDENGNPIYTPRQAALLSLAQGFVEGALEKRSIATAGKAVFSTATATKLSEIYAKDVALAEGQTLSGATREAISNVVKERVRHGIKAGGVSFGAELEEEFEQKVSDMVLENMAQIAVRGDKADVASVEKILEDSFAEAAEAIPAVAGFSLLGVGGAVVNDAKTIHDTRKRFINSRANSIMNNYYINDEMKNILHGVADNLDNIADLEAKAPEVVEQILDTQNEKVGLKEVEVDIGELKQIGQTDVIDTIAKKANVSQEELMACLNGTGRLTVAFSKLQMATRELSDEGKKALDNNVSTVGGVTDRENKENVELLKMIADTMKKRTDEETSEVVSQFVQGTYADEETRKLAKEIIEADLSNPYEEVKRRQRDVASLIDEYLGDTIAQMKAEGGQGVDIVVGEEGRGTRVSNNPQWYQNWYADHEKPPTDEDYERLAYEFETGQATRYAIGSYGDVTPEEAELYKEKQKFFDELFAERERLKKIQQSLEGIKKDDFLAYASLPVEARQVYHVFADALSQSDSADVRKSATANAIVASMIAHRIAEARRAHGENVSDLDVIPNIGSTEQGELKQFAGQKSLTANTQKLSEAMSMEQTGATANEIYKKTGWLKGKEGGWRYEIKDKLNSIDLSKTLKHKGAKLSDVYDNKELFDAYPQLKDIQVSAVKMPKQSYGETLIYDDGRLRIHINKNRIDEELDLKTTIVHEIAHCIQAIEGFANGASPSDVRDYLKQNKVEVPQGSDYTLYERIAGEQEAREVEKRARATMLLENKDKAIAEGDNSKKAKFARKVLAQAANRMPVPHKADAIVVLGDVGVEVSANVETPAVSAEKVVDEFLQSAWHGSPHLFKEFDLGKIGTGEGAQAHGWGLYFAQSREVAEGYRDRLSSFDDKITLTIDGKELTINPPQLKEVLLPYVLEIVKSRETALKELAPNLTEEQIKDFASTIADSVAKRIESEFYNASKQTLYKATTMIAHNYDLNRRRYQEAVEQNEVEKNVYGILVEQSLISLRTIKKISQVRARGGGSLFEVDIPNDDVMLDEQKEFKEQSSKVKEAVRRCLKDIFPSKYNNSDIADMFLSTADSKYSKLERSISGMRGTISQMEEWLEYFETGNVTPTVAFSMDDDKRSVIQKFRLYPLNVKEGVFHLSLDKFISANYDAYAQELAKVPQEEIDAFDVKEALREGIEKRKKEIDKETKEINKFFKEGFDKWFTTFADGLTGRELYCFLDECMGSDKNASILLNDYGIEGISYVGGIDGRCFVVFNDTAINIINTYNQKINGETKGSYSPTKHMLTLFKTADQSTFMHEMSHFYLSELMKIAKIDENSAEAKMLKTITDWAEWHKGDAEAFKGTASYNEFLAYEKAILEAEKKGTAKLNDKEYTKEQLLSIWVQEKFARGFETYLQSGEAPTTGLKRIFARFKQWLKNIYLAYTGAGVEPSSDVKAIMARMVATDEAIAMASIERKVSVLRNKLGDDVFEKDTEELREKWLQEAEEEAKAKLLARLIKQQEQKNIDEHMKAYEETIREQLTEENAFVVQALIEEGFTEEEAITGIYPSVDVWKKDLEAKGGSYEKAIEKAVTEERERYKQEMPSEEELRSMAEEELVSHTTELEAMEAEILARREKKYNELPAKVTSAIAEMDEALEFEESDNPLKLALTKLKYAYRWNEQQKAQIENMQKQIDALKEKSAEEKKHLKAELKTNLQAFKENTLLNKNWLRGVRDATKGKVKEIRAFATNNLMTMPIREATDTKRFIGEARKEAKTVLAKLTKAISGNKQTKISLSTETALSSTMQEAEAEKDNSTIREAYYAKIREAVYVEQARQSVRIKQGVEKMKARLTRIGKSVSKDKKAEFDASTHYYIGHILYMTGITKKDARRPQTLVDFDEFINGLMRDFEGNSENETVDYKVPSWLKELAMSKGDADDYRAYRFGEMQDLTTLIVNIYTTARNKDRLFTSDKKASEVQKEMLEDYKHTVTVKDGKILSHELGEYLLGLIQPSRLLETLGGSYKRYIYDVLAEANEKKKAMQQVAADSLNALFDKYWDANTRRKLRSEKDYVAPNGQKLSKENILVMALNWGNTGNRTRVINTFSANIEDEGEALRVKSEIEKLFEDVLTARDWQFVQDVWQFIGAYGDRVSTVVETETGTPMKRVEAEPFEIATSDGLLINVDGGYYPIAYDTENATGYIDEEGVPTLSTAAGANGVFNANMGSTKDRSKEGVVGGKIRLDMDKLFAHVNQQIHIATMRLAWRDAYKLIKSRPIRETIVQTYGAKAYYSLKGWVEDCWSTPIQKRTWVEQITDKLRQRTVTAIMAYRVSTSILNLANPVYMAREIGAMNTLHALVDYYGNPKEMAKKRAWVKRQSSFMRNRAHNLDRDFNRTKTDSFDRGNPVRRLISQYGNYMIEETDLWFSIPTYYWTYKQAYNEELGKGTSNETAKKVAHRKAEDTVRRIFGSSETVDQSEVQRSRSLFMKAMTPFYTFASTQANHLFGEYLKSKYQGYNIKELEDGTIEREKKKFYKTYWGMFNSFVYTYVLGAFVEQAIRELISQIAGDDKDKKEKLKRMKQGFATRAFAQGVQSLGSGFPIGNIVASYVANEILGETYGASNFGMIDAAYSRYGQAWKDTTGYFKGKKDALEAGRSVTKAFFGAGLGIPDTLVDTAFNGARAYVDHYSVEDWFRKSLFDKRLKQKGK